MKVEIKNVKYAEFASDDSLCFTATVYIDGKRQFTAKDDGNGGGCFFYPLGKEKQNELHKRIHLYDAVLGKTKIIGNWGTMKNCLEFEIGDRMNEWLKIKEAKKLLRRICYLNNGSIYTLPAKWKPTDKNFEGVKKASWWKSSYKILNEMKIEDVLEYV